jgi:hypothetical protein
VALFDGVTAALPLRCQTPPLPRSAWLVLAADGVLAAGLGRAFLLACVAVLALAILVARQLERLLPATLNLEQT